MKTAFVCLLLLASFNQAHAQSAPNTSTSTSTLPVATVPTTLSTSTSVIPSLAPIQYGDYRLRLGVSALNTSGRAEEMTSEKGRRYRLKYEYFGGVLHSSGWGMQALAVTNGNTFKENSNNKIGAGDPSLTLIHPTLFQNSDVKVTGQLRRYLAVTDRSKDRNQAQWAYYNYTTVKLSNSWSVWNQLTPRFFAQSYYKADDTTYYVEDYTSLSKQMYHWLRLGVGQHTQIEWHDKTSPGSVVEVYPMADFVLSTNAFLQTRLVMPIQKVNAVYDSPGAVALNQTQAELYLQISI